MITFQQPVPPALEPTKPQSWSYSKLGSSIEPLQIEKTDTTDTALVVYAGIRSWPFLASLWVRGGVGGEILVIDKNSEGDRDYLEVGRWFNVTFRPFPYKEDERKHLKYVKHLVTKFQPANDENRPEFKIDKFGILQLKTTIKLNCRVLRLPGIPSDLGDPKVPKLAYRIFKCQATGFGSAHVVLERTTVVEDYIAVLSRGIKRIEKSKEWDYEAILEFLRADVFNGKLFWFISRIRDIKMDRWIDLYPMRTYNKTEELPEYAFMNLEYFEFGPETPEPEELEAPMEALPILELEQERFLKLSETVPEGHGAHEAVFPAPEPVMEPRRPPSPKPEAPRVSRAQASLLAHLSQCRSKDDLATFVETKKENLESLMMDTANLQSSVQNVRVICLFCTEYGLAICFSPQYGWCVAKEGLIGKSFRAAMEPGNWFSVPLCPAISSKDGFQVANWIVLPGSGEASPPFNVFCRNKSSVVAVIEAMAYDNLRRVQNDFGSKFLILETSMGQVWMPGSIEKRGQGPAEMVEIPCPPRCACGGAYRNYEDPNTEAPVDHRRRDSDTTIDELLASEDSEFQRIVEFQTLPSVSLLDLGFEGSPPSSSIPKPFQNGSLNKMIPAFDHDKSRSSSGSTPRESINGHPANPEQIVSNATASPRTKPTKCEGQAGNRFQHSDMLPPASASSEAPLPAQEALLSLPTSHLNGSLNLFEAFPEVVCFKEAAQEAHHPENDDEHVLSALRERHENDALSTAMFEVSSDEEL